MILQQQPSTFLQHSTFFCSLFFVLTQSLLTQFPLPVNQDSAFKIGIKQTTYFLFTAIKDY